MVGAGEHHHVVAGGLGGAVGASVGVVVGCAHVAAAVETGCAADIVVGATAIVVVTDIDPAMVTASDAVVESAIGGAVVTVSVTAVATANAIAVDASVRAVTDCAIDGDDVPANGCVGAEGVGENGNGSVSGPLKTRRKRRRQAMSTRPVAESYHGQMAPFPVAVRSRANAVHLCSILVSSPHS